MKRLTLCLLLFALAASQAIGQGSRVFQDTYVHVKIRADSVGVPIGTPESGVVWLFSRGNQGWWTKDHAGNLTPLAGASNLDQLLNVLVTSIHHGDILYWDSTAGKWKNTPTAKITSTPGYYPKLDTDGDTLQNGQAHDSLGLLFSGTSKVTLNKDIYTLGSPAGLDSSMITAGRIIPLWSGNNEHVDSILVHTAGASVDFRFNVYSGTTIGTATDSLLTANWNVTTANGREAKVAGDCRNSASLGYKYWWLKVTAITNRPELITVQFKVDRP